MPFDQHYDLAIVGGGLAGSALAIAMARGGSNVLLIERDAEYRDRVRGEWLAPWGVTDVRKLDLLDVFEAAGAHILPAIAGRAGRPLHEETPEGDLARTFFHPAVQQALIEAAEAAGATVARPARVREVTPASDGANPSLRFDHDGDSHEVTASLIVGADGRTSLVRTALDHEPVEHRSERMLTGVRLAGVEGDPEMGYLIVSPEPGGLTALFPQGDGHARVYLFTHEADASAYRGDEGLKHFIDGIVEIGLPAEVVANATAAGPLAAFSASDSWIPHPHGNGLVLIGDAAGMSDPTWGMGMALLFRDARVLSEALRATDDWPAALDQYTTERAQYFEAVLTAEDWLSELLLAPGDEARQRARHAQHLWGTDPPRAIDLPGLGPDNDLSGEARVRFFGEDVPIEA
ncbi:MAG: FAD-dependent monooxygenase [Dehalococcoidia bacterium]|jgi:menaquinone-9 beta-reductase|nr:FAD-dependent monooxygenase [Dehalococcoidia bacterium]